MVRPDTRAELQRRLDDARAWRIQMLAVGERERAALCSNAITRYLAQLARMRG